MIVSLSLVVYNPNVPVLIDCLLSLQYAIHLATQRIGELSVELSLIDNSLNPEQSAALETLVREQLQLSDRFTLNVIISPVNGGYGHGNNLAIQRAESDYHIVINPDIYLNEDALVVALEYLEANPHVALLTPAVFGLDGERHYLCKRHPTLWVMFLRSFAPACLKRYFESSLLRYEMRERDYDAIMTDVQFPTGCLMFTRTLALQAIGGFDERFFMYFEDADVGRRIVEQGEIHYVPTVRVRHKWARGTHNNAFLRRATIISALKYWRKWGGIW